MTQDLELRVLTGLHQGAACAVQDGALLGADAMCDVVLCDDGIAGEAARLSIGDGTWRLSTPASQDDAPGSPFGTALPLGPVYLTLSYPADPWPDLTEFSALVARSTAPAHAAARDATPDQHPIGARATCEATPERLDPPARGRTGLLATRRDAAFRPPISRPRKGLGMRWAMGGLLFLLLFGSVASFSPAKVQSSPRMEMELNEDAPALLRVQRLLQEQGYAERIQATIGPDHVVAVTGWVLDQAEHDRLATALSAVWPLPSLRVDNQAITAARIAARAQDLDVYVVPEFRQPGQVTIRGIAASDSVRAEAYGRWRDDDGLSTPARMTLLLADEVADALDKAVAASGLPRVASAWKGKALQVDPHGIHASQLVQLQALLDKLNERYMNALQLIEGRTSIPFRVLTVVGGKQPWVVLEDGTRIVVGGTHGAYRLTSIEDGRVIFDGPTTTVIAR